MLSLALFAPVQEQDALGLMSLSGSTGNQGNMFIVSKMMTWKFPLCCFLMKLREQMATRRAAWGGRPGAGAGANSEADAFANGDVSQFDVDLEIKADYSSLKWFVLRYVESRCKCVGL